jgi:uncharacterized repeat protein (TIGR04138 family)
MSIPSRQQTLPQQRFHPDAYDFLKVALRYTVHRVRQVASQEVELPDQPEHVTGQELLEGIRHYALDQFGLLTMTVFDRWGITCTEDFGRMVFEMIDQGEMFKTDHDQLSDFLNVYEFDQAFNWDYEIDTSKTFAR